MDKRTANILIQTLLVKHNRDDGPSDFIFDIESYNNGGGRHIVDTLDGLKVTENIDLPEGTYKLEAVNFESGMAQVVLDKHTLHNQPLLDEASRHGYYEIRIEQLLYADL
jgi:hypothetical protein